MMTFSKIATIVTLLMMISGLGTAQQKSVNPAVNWDLIQNDQFFDWLQNLNASNVVVQSQTVDKAIATKAN